MQNRHPPSEKPLCGQRMIFTGRHSFYVSYCVDYTLGHSVCTVLCQFRMHWKTTLNADLLALCVLLLQDTFFIWQVWLVFNKWCVNWKNISWLICNDGLLSIFSYCNKWDEKFNKKNPGKHRDWVQFEYLNVVPYFTLKVNHFIKCFRN